MTTLGPLGRLGRWTATHFRAVAVGWVVVAVALGVFAPRVEHALSGAGWEATGSESVQARDLIDSNFPGLGSYGLMVVVHSPSETVDDPAFKRAVADVERTLKADDAVTAVVAPQPGVSISRDGHTAVVQAGAGGDPNDMVRAADDLKGALGALGGDGVEVEPDRRARHVVGLQRGQQDGDDEVRADLLAGHARHPRARLRLARRRRAAADAHDPRAWSPRPARCTSARSCWTSRSGR